MIQMPRTRFMCDSCKSFDVVKVMNQEVQLSVAGLRKSASQNCSFCSLVMNQLKDRMEKYYAVDLRLWVRLAFTANNVNITKSCHAPGITAMTANLFLPEMKADLGEISLPLAADCRA